MGKFQKATSMELYKTENFDKACAEEYKSMTTKNMKKMDIVSVCWGWDCSRPRLTLT